MLWMICVSSGCLSSPRSDSVCMVTAIQQELCFCGSPLWWGDSPSVCWLAVNGWDWLLCVFLLGLSGRKVLAPSSISPFVMAICVRLLAIDLALLIV